MEKQVIEYEIIYDLNWNRKSIAEIREDLDNIEKRGANYIIINTDEYSCEILAYERRLETDSEQAERLRIEQERSERQKERDLKQYEIIKSKYNL